MKKALLIIVSLISIENFAQEKPKLVVGIVVDSVSDVMELTSDSIRSAPDIESAIDNSCILGLGSVGERMLILLDIEKLMSGVDMGLVTVDE